MSRFKSIYNTFLFYEFLNNLVVFGPLLMPFYTLISYLNMTQIMVLNSIYQFSIFIWEIPTGIVGDKFGRKFSVLAGNFLYSLGMFLFLQTY